MNGHAVKIRLTQVVYLGRLNRFHKILHAVHGVWGCRLKYIINDGMFDFGKELYPVEIRNSL